MTFRFSRFPVSPRAAALVSLGFMALATGCRAPGMKLDVQATQPEQQMELSGVKVTLRPITPAVLKAQAAPATPADLMELLAAKPGPYRVGPQDILQIIVWDHPELTPIQGMIGDANTGAVVEEDGCFYFPHVGRMAAAGLTVTEVRTRLTEGLARTLRNPQVDVKVRAYRSQKVLVSGEVRTAGTHTVTDVPFTLSEAANRAGGFLPSADLSRVQLTRGEKRWTLHVMDLMSQGSRLGQILLKDGDTLHVPHRDEAPVYLLGEVRNPRSVPLYHGRISLAQALSEAGGVNMPSADARSIYVLRGAGDRVEVFHLDGYSPVAMVLADRFALQPRDVVYVDPGTLVRWNRVMSLLVPTVSALTSTTSEIKYLTK